MRTELEELRVALKLAERLATNGNGVLNEIRIAQEAFDKLEARYKFLQSETPQKIRKTNWHLSVPADVPFDAVMARIFVKALRQLPWPKGIVVRFLASHDTGYKISHEFAVHHESLDVGCGMEVVEHD